MRTDEIEGLAKVGHPVASIMARAARPGGSAKLWSALFRGLPAWKQRRGALLDLKITSDWRSGHWDLTKPTRSNARRWPWRPAIRLLPCNSGMSCRAYPIFAKASPHALMILLGLKLFDEAEALMRERQGSPRLTASHELPSAAATVLRGTKVGLRCHLLGESGPVGRHGTADRNSSQAVSRRNPHMDAMGEHRRAGVTGRRYSVGGARSCGITRSISASAREEVGRCEEAETSV